MLITPAESFKHVILKIRINVSPFLFNLIQKKSCDWIEDARVIGPKYREIFPIATLGGGGNINAINIMII